ncbi:MAG TPA: tetronasin resistance protein [Eubacteriaceae bacterium]|nr:tetronasin resistance protein [Eubacteriaceae bacterium]
MKEKFAHWDMLFVQYLKRDWKKIAIWVLGLGLFSAGLVPAFVEIGKGDGTIAMYETLQNPAMISIVGPTPVETASEYTIGAMYAHEMLLFCGLFAMTISILHVIGHTRKEEDLGLTELIRSFQVGRQANSLAVMVETVFINILLAMLISGVMINYRIDGITVGGSVLFGTSIAMAGIVGAGIALVMAQIMPISSSAIGSSLGIMGFLYIIRGVTDISNVKLSMINPLGWFYLTYPFVENRWLPVILASLFSIIMIIIAFALEEGRDMGAGYIPQREGRANAKKSLLSVYGLFIHLNKGVIISWLITFFVLGIAYGAIYGDMQGFLESNELMKRMFAYAGFSIEESFSSTVMVVMAGLVTILPIVIVNKLFSEEKNLYLSQIYGTKVRRRQLYWTSVSLAIITSIIGVFLAAGSLGGTAISVMENSPMNIMDFLLIGFNLLPTILFFTGLAALILGWWPSLGKIVYVYLGYSFFLSYFEGILDLPEWLIKTTPQSWLPKIPMEDFNALIFIIITAISIGLMIFGYIGYKRRDMIERA